MKRLSDAARLACDGAGVETRNAVARVPAGLDIMTEITVARLPMQFDRDAARNRANIERHGLAFDLARRIFDGPKVDAVDALNGRSEFGERRAVSLGLLDGLVVLAIVQTDRAGRMPLISAKRASRKEWQMYHDEIPKAVERG